MQRLDYAARMAVPFILAISFTILGVVRWPIPYLGTITPLFALMIVYYWAIHRPDLFRPSMAFAIGLLNDILQQMPIGISALLLVILYQIVFNNRRFFSGHSFFMMWVGFLMTTLAYGTLIWLMLSIWEWQFYPALPLVVQMIFSIVLFPLPCWVLIKIQRVALSAE